jgi:hypothetical protein
MHITVIALNLYNNHMDNTKLNDDAGDKLRDFWADTTTGGAASSTFQQLGLTSGSISSCDMLNLVKSLISMLENSDLTKEAESAVLERVLKISDILVSRGKATYTSIPYVPPFGDQFHYRGVAITCDETRPPLSVTFEGDRGITTSL